MKRITLDGGIAVEAPDDLYETIEGALFAHPEIVPVNEPAIRAKALWDYKNAKEEPPPYPPETGPEAGASSAASAAEHADNPDLQ